MLKRVSKLLLKMSKLVGNSFINLVQLETPKTIFFQKELKKQLLGNLANQCQPFESFLKHPCSAVQLFFIFLFLPPVLGAMSSESCICLPGVVDGAPYNPWIAKHFEECVYNPYDYASFISGLVSVAFFIIALPPQIYINYKRKAVQGLSLSLLLGWALGDLANFAGTILTHQLFFQKVLGAYFLLLDTTLCCQYFYYTRVYQKVDGVGDGEEVVVSDERTKLLAAASPGGETGGSSSSRGKGKSKSWWSLVAILAFVVKVTGQSTALNATRVCNSSDFDSTFTIVLGSLCAWGSGLLYFFSRYVFSHYVCFLIL
jgi:hypothetical protein